MSALCVDVSESRRPTLSLTFWEKTHPLEIFWAQLSDIMVATATISAHAANTAIILWRFLLIDIPFHE
jgi:hypothetical protein